MTPRTFLQKYALLIMAGFFFLAPVLMHFAGKTVSNNNNNVADWLPSDFTETGELAWFRDHFFGDQFVILSWDGCKLGGDPDAEGAEADDPRIEQVAKLLVSDTKVRDVPLSRYFKSVTTGRRVLNQLTAPPMSVPYDEAVTRLTGSLIGDDGHRTCLVVTMTPAAVGKFRDAIGRGKSRLMKSRQISGILFEALEACHVDTEYAYLGGPPADNVAIDEEGEKTLVRLAGLSGLLGIGLAWYSLRSVRLTTIVLGCGLLSAAGALATVSIMGYQSDAVMLSMPSLVYVLAISGAVHLITYYREALHTTGVLGAAEKAIAHGWKPAFLCSVTTAIGLISLYSSNLVPIRKFGLFSALGVMSTLIVLFAFLPAALHLWPEKLPTEKTPPKKRGESRWARFVRIFETSADQFWGRFGGAIVRHHAAVLLGCMLFIGVVGWGVTYVHTTIDLMKLFDKNARVIHDYEWLEANVGRLVPMELVLSFDKDSQRAIEKPADEAAAGAAMGGAEAAEPTAEELAAKEKQQFDDLFRLSLLERMETVAAVQHAVNKRFGVDGENVIGPSLSAVTFAPPLPAQRGDTRTFLYRTTMNRKLEENHAKLLGTEYLRVEPESGNELWRISLRVAAFKEVDYGQFTHHVRQVVEPVLIAQRERFRVLRELSAINDGGSYAAGNVCLWAGTAPAEGQEAQVSLVETLHQQLLASRIKVNLVNMPESELKELPIAMLQKYSLVVMAGEFSPELLEKLKSADVRTMQLPPATESLPGALSGKGTSEVQRAAAALAGPEAAAASNLPVTAVYTGVVPIVYKAQRALLSSLISSSFWSFTTITPLLMLVSRGVLAGMVTMIPNVLPVLVVFGGMGWLGLNVDIGSMMAASIALGVAVDDTIHYLTWFREDLVVSDCRESAIMAAYKRCATPTLQSALINGLGLSVFAFSTFTPTRQFGYLMLTILIAGVVAELIMLPALLAGPLGKTFGGKAPASKPTEVSPSAEPSADESPAEPHAVPAPHGKLLERNKANQQAMV